MGVLRVPLSPLAVGPLELPHNAARYVLRVHRLGTGDRFVAFDPEARVEADAVITQVSRDSALVELGPLRGASLLPTRSVTIVQALAKGDKLDAVVRDATELGATVISPAVALRSIADQRSGAGLERWRRIAIEAARQCGRGDVPRVDAPLPLSEIIRPLRGGLGVVLVPGTKTALGPLLAAANGVEPLAFVIGPEGGLDPSEIAACEASGFVTASLGRLVLRTETACAAVLGAALAFSDPS